jgi:4-hydroxybenzoate polyprenyltransferase
MATIIPFLYSFPPIQLKTKPFLDTATNGLTAMVIISMGYFFYGAKPISQVALLTIAAVFLGVSGMHILGTLRDYTADKNAQATTVAVLLGQRLAAILGAFIFLLLLLVTQNFPLEFRFCAVYGITCFAALAVKPGEKLTQGLGIILLMGFFVASTISLLTGSWGKFF